VKEKEFNDESNSKGQGSKEEGVRVRAHQVERKPDTEAGGVVFAGEEYYDKILFLRIKVRLSKYSSPEPQKK
jgi:hypothetical protein